MSSALPSFALRGSMGSASSALPSSTTSACPSCKIRSIWPGSLSEPTHATGHETAWQTLAAK